MKGAVRIHRRLSLAHCAIRPPRSRPPYPLAKSYESKDLRDLKRPCPLLGCTRRSDRNDRKAPVSWARCRFSPVIHWRRGSSSPRHNDTNGKPTKPENFLAWNSLAAKRSGLTEQQLTSTPPPRSPLSIIRPQTQHPKKYKPDYQFPHRYGVPCMPHIHHKTRLEHHYGLKVPCSLSAGPSRLEINMMTTAARRHRCQAGYGTRYCTLPGRSKTHVSHMC